MSYDCFCSPIKCKYPKLTSVTFMSKEYKNTNGYETPLTSIVAVPKLYINVLCIQINSKYTNGFTYAKYEVQLSNERYM